MTQEPKTQERRETTSQRVPGHPHPGGVQPTSALATGALARWARACATHPWRVVFSWLGIIVVLIALVATVGGSLRDEFEIPGRTPRRRPT